MDDLKAIRVFLEVADQLSFSKAAQVMRLNAASVTRIVSKLEDYLGQQLFVRTTRQVSLTSAGAALAARYRPVIAEFDRITDDTLRASKPDMGRLRINAPLSMGIRVMPRLVESFRLAYPRIELDVHLTDTLVDIIAESCDLAIRVSGPPSDKSTIWRKICQVPRHAIAAPALFERIPMPESPDDLAPETLLSYSAAGEAEIWEFRSGTQHRTIRAGTQIVSNNGDFLYELARAGGGICGLPDFIVREGLDKGDIVRVLPDWELEPLWLTLFYPPYEKLPPLVETFTDFFEAYVKEFDDLLFS